MIIDPNETREEFEARYPRPDRSAERVKRSLMTRVLIRCRCNAGGYDENDQPIEHWAWGYWDFRFPGLDPHETLAEERPDFEKITGRPITKEDLEL